MTYSVSISAMKFLKNRRESAARGKIAVRLEKRIQDYVCLAVSNKLGYIVTVDVIEQPPGHLKDEYASVFYSHIKEDIFVHCVRASDSLRGSKRLIVLVHEFGHIMDFYNISQELRHQLTEDFFKRKKSKRFLVGVWIEAEKRAWMEGFKLLKLMGAPKWIMDAFWGIIEESIDSWIKDRQAAVEKELKAWKRKISRRKAKRK